ncbi:MAG: hypothetical protein WCK27_31885 [Verrucomicrobiota bacterium]|jgi:hypothetical protein
MKHILRTLAFVSLAACGVCGTDNWWLFHKAEFTNAAGFHKMRSGTNLPPEVVSAGSSSGSSWTIEADDSQHPTWAKEWRLIWAFTNDTYCVVHTEYVLVDHPGTNHWIVIATRPKTNGAPAKVHRIPYHYVKDFGTFAREHYREQQTPILQGF